MSQNPVEDFAYVVQLAKERQTFGHMLSHVRRIDETDEKTLRRMIENHLGVIKLLEEHGVSARSVFHWNYEFKEDLLGPLRQLIESLRRSDETDLDARDGAAGRKTEGRGTRVE